MHHCFLWRIKHNKRNTLSLQRIDLAKAKKKQINTWLMEQLKLYNSVKNYLSIIRQRQVGALLYRNTHKDNLILLTKSLDLIFLGQCLLNEWWMKSNKNSETQWLSECREDFKGKYQDQLAFWRCPQEFKRYTRLLFHMTCSPFELDMNWFCKYLK